MTKRDRDLIVKIGKRLGAIEKELKGKVNTADLTELMKEARKISPAPQAEASPPQHATIDHSGRPAPFCKITTQFIPEPITPELTSRVTKQQETLRTILTDFCRMNGIEGLQVEYKEQPPQMPPPRSGIPTA